MEQVGQLILNYLQRLDNINNAGVGTQAAGMIAWRVIQMKLLNKNELGTATNIETVTTS